MDEELKAVLKEWGLAQQWVDKLEDEEVWDLETLLRLPQSEIDLIITKAGPRATLKAKMEEALENVVLTEDDLTNIAIEIIISHLKMENRLLFAKKSPLSQKGTTSDSNAPEGTASQSNALEGSSRNANSQQENHLPENTEQLVSSINETEVQHHVQDAGNETDRNNQDTPSRVRIVPSVLGKRPHQPSEEDLEVKRLGLEGVNKKIVFAYYNEHGELNDETRLLLAGVVINEYLKDDYNKKFPVEVEKSFTDSILKLFPNEKKNIWMAPETCNRETSAGRGRLLLSYYAKRRQMKKGGLLKKKDSPAFNTSVEDLADIDADVDPVEFEEKLLWLTNNKTQSSRLTDYWKYTAKGRLKKFISGKIPTAEYMQTYPALSESTGYLLLESDFETLFEGVSMNLYAAWPTLAAFIESKVPKTIKEGILDTLTPEGQKIKTIQALPYLFQVVTAAKKGRNKNWRPSREESAEAILLHVIDDSAILTTLANRLKDKYEPFNLSLGPQAIVVGETVDSITKSYVRVNSILYEVDNPIKAVDITFKIMHALDCQYPKESEREWFFLERSIYRINTDKKNPLTGKIASICSEFSRYSS